ncbi:hypothetical protein N7466_001834 [Penicillium verhagenii]|uniref:uncharacterized protein n=1 Tax=Penicillium verhagenii TaxID=1562060 RepID=UPI0025450E32|nr:uncharacterized protein N7466_001834 [Penicillium verhagenii]KAJ5938700.1 hypothetical protein N7466_001834 [Penicillium verhagenii]
MNSDYYGTPQQNESAYSGPPPPQGPHQGYQQSYPQQYQEPQNQYSQPQYSQSYNEQQQQTAPGEAQVDERGLGGALAGGAVGGFAGHKANHGFLGAIGGAIAGSIAQDAYKKHQNASAQNYPPQGGRYPQQFPQQPYPQAGPYQQYPQGPYPPSQFYPLDQLRHNKKSVMKRQEEVEELQDKINRVSQHMQQGPSHHKMKDLRKDMEDYQKDLRKAQEDYQKELDKALE